ncbi:hypothetical protein [Geminicoccus harenae]|uniref:hypothetical protein n=1 Tax=Geminicoccus harenae TaxID=2498453 RepID=UPI00168A9C5F|nr:hypothetical protein [Geminicoccus harenae]
MARVSQALQFRTTRQSSRNAKTEADPDAALIEAVAAALLENDERSDCLREIIRHLAPPLHDELRQERGDDSDGRH